MREYLLRVVERVREVLGERLVGVYPTGSLALHGYTDGRSDVDLLAVVEVPVAPATVRRLAERLSHDALPCPATGLEFVLYSHQTAAAGTIEPDYLLDLNTGRELPSKVSFGYTGGHAFWYAIDRDVAYQADAALTGPPPRQVFRRVPYERLMAVVIASIEAHAQSDAGHLLDNSVLNACRALRYAEERRWHAKPDAARWAVSEVTGFAPLIRQALVNYPNGRAAGETLPADQVARFLQHICDRLNTIS